MAIINTYTKLTKTQAKAKVYATYTEVAKMVAEEVDRAGNPYGRMIPAIQAIVIAYKTQKAAMKEGRPLLGKMTIGELQAMQETTRNEMGPVGWNVTYKGNLAALKLNRKAKA